MKKASSVLPVNRNYISVVCGDLFLEFRFIQRLCGVEVQLLEDVEQGCWLL